MTVRNFNHAALVLLASCAPAAALSCAGEAVRSEWSGEFAVSGTVGGKCSLLIHPTGTQGITLSVSLAAAGS